MIATTLKPYYYREIEDYGGVTSPDYRTFERKYKNYLNKICKANGWELVKFSPNHYCFSCFIKNGKQYIYLSISDVRHFSTAWRKTILIRLADSDTDYTGGSNHYTSLEALELNLQNLFAIGRF